MYLIAGLIYNTGTRYSIHCAVLPHAGVGVSIAVHLSFAVTVHATHVAFRMDAHTRIGLRPIAQIFTGVMQT